MRLSARLFWIATGIVLSVCVGYFGFVNAQTQPAAGTSRLIITPATTTNRHIKRAVWVKDSQTGACWLGHLQGDGAEEVFSALAPAPTTACP
jgi:hypothetical protein